MAITTYQNFDLLITRSGDDYRAFVVDAPGGDADSVFALPFTADELNFLGNLAGSRRGGTGGGGTGSASDLKELGSLLYGAVIQGKVATVLATSLEKVEQEQVGLRLRLRFSDETSELATLPWEILYDPMQERFLALSESSPILRYLSLPKARPTLLVEPPLRVLAVLVSPPGYEELDVEREWQMLETALAGLVGDGKFVLDRLGKPTFAALHERLLGDDIHILHFVGHGVYDETQGAGALVLANEQGEAQTVSGEELATLLHNHRSLRLVYLNACEGALSSHLSVFSGVAQTLVQQGVPAAVAMQAEITDDAAIELSRIFYTALATGYPVDAALTQARVAIARRSAEWAIPVLFSRSMDNRLFDVVKVLPAPDCPYPGMVPFSEKQANVFFGRDREISDAIERLRQYPFLTVIGPSGSGKSSLVYAGVIPELRRSRRFGPGKWDVRTLRPGAKPLTALAEALQTNPENLSSIAFDQHTLLFVDQFEEIFTLAESTQAQPFLDGLNNLIQKPHLYLILTVRADFYPELMASSLWQPIRANRLELTPLGDEELRAAILQPAAQVGVTIDEVLAERLVADAAGELGALPLVQEALVLLWERVGRRHLALSAYAEMVDGSRNGLQVAIDRRATVVYNNLAEEAKPVARRIFLRLVQFGEGRLDTRRQQTLDELQATGDDTSLFDETLDKLTANRLLTTSGEEGSGRRVDIAHEALIGGWGLLRKWIGERRAAEQTRRRLEGKAAEWVKAEKHGWLLDVYELQEAKNWLADEDAQELGCSQDLVDLVKASTDSLARAAAEREAAIQRELSAAQALTREAEARHKAEQNTWFEKVMKERSLRRQGRYLGIIFLLIAATIVVASILYNIFYSSQDLADDYRKLAGETQRNATYAESQTEIATTRLSQLERLVDSLDSRRVQLMVHELESMGDTSGAIVLLDRAIKSDPVLIENVRLDGLDANGRKLWVSAVANVIMELQGIGDLAGASAVREAASAAGLLHWDDNNVEYAYVSAGTLVAESGPERALKGFWIMRTEVTNEQYARCVAVEVCTPPGLYNRHWRKAEYTGYPVTGIDWEQANSYAEWVGGRLPTRLEWIMACRGDSENIYPWGDNEPHPIRLNYADSGKNGVVPIGSYPPGANGLYDLAGNVSEWTDSRWTDSQSYLNFAVVSGGSFKEEIAEIRCDSSTLVDPKQGYDNVGFRVAATPRS